MSRALSAAQDALGREQRLTAIGGLAAAAAHELGTPLATIKLVTGELARELKDDPDLAEDVELIRAQAERCREILREMSETGKDDRHVRTLPIYGLVEEAAGPHRARGKRVILRLQGAPLSDPPPAQPEVERRPEVIHGLRNLVQNAVDFAADCVWVDIDWDDRQIRIAVGDDGPGFGADMLGRLGDPFVRNRLRRQEWCQHRKESNRTDSMLRPDLAATTINLMEPGPKTLSCWLFGTGAAAGPKRQTISRTSGCSASDF